MDSICNSQYIEQKYSKVGAIKRVILEKSDSGKGRIWKRANLEMNYSGKERFLENSDSGKERI